MSELTGRDEIQLERYWRMELAGRLRAVADGIENNTLDGMSAEWEGGTAEPKLSIKLKKPLEFVKLSFTVENKDGS